MPSPTKVVSAYPDDIWDLFKVETTYVPPEIGVPNRRSGRYQLLEVVVATLMHVQRPEYQWEVTPRSGDDGMDFLGRRTLLDVPQFLRGEDVLVGQCKRTSQVASPGDLLAWDLGRMNKLLPSHMIVAYAGRTSSKKRQQVIDFARTELRRSLFFLGIEELDFLIRLHLPSLRETIERALPDDADRVLAHFSSGGVPGPRPAIRVTAPAAGETGRPFEVEVNVQSSAAPLRGIRCVWEWPASEGPEGPVTTLRLITPSAAAESGIEVGLGDAFSSSIHLKLIGYRAGTQPLGYLVLHLPGGEQERVALGTVNLADQYHPPFYHVPFTRELSRFEDFWGQARGGHLHVVNVVGAGGAGKTRLCQEFGYRAEQDGGRYIFRSHPNNLEQPYRILCDVLRALVPDAVSLDDPGTVMRQYLRRRNAELAERMGPTINLLYGGRGAARRERAAFDRNALVQTLCLLLLDAARRQPLLLHVSDCHWAQAEALDILSEAVERLRDVQDRALTRIVFVFEGREHESLPAALTADDTTGTVAWERFLAHGPPPVRVLPLDGEESRGFLHFLFENTQAADRRVPEHLVPHQDELIGEILRFAAGNPFHMIEQLRLLLDLGVVVRNERTGLLYLGRRLPEQYAVPAEVGALIHLRYDYLRRRNPAAALLLAACAFLRDRLPRPLYALLKERLAPGVPDDELLQTDFLLRPGSPAEPVAFRHENYYEVMRALELDAPARDRIVAAYLEWLDSLPSASAQELFERGLVLEHAGAPDWREVRRLYEQSLGLAETEHRSLLSAAVVRRLLPLVDADANAGADQALHAVRLNRRAASLLVETGSWGEAQVRFAAIVERIRKLLRSPPQPLSPEARQELEYSLYRCVADQANVHIDLLRQHEAIAQLTDALPVMERRARSAPDSLDWPGVYLTAANRLGVAHWFDGRPTLARHLFRSGVRESRRVGNLHWEFHNLLDLATVSIHRSPRRAAALLTRCMELLDRWPSPASPRLYYLARFQRGMAELVRIAGTGRGVPQEAKPHLLALQSELDAVYADSCRDGYVHEQAGAALMAGACTALLDVHDAPRWFMRAIAVTNRAVLMEFAWKAHLNLAQLCLEGDAHVREGAGLHAEQAERLVREDLERRTRDEDRRYRLALYGLPLAQLARVWQALGDPRAATLLADFPHAGRFFNGPEIRSDRHENDQVLHVSRGPADLFLMS